MLRCKHFTPSFRPFSILISSDTASLQSPVVSGVNEMELTWKNVVSSVIVAVTLPRTVYQESES